LPQYPVGTLVVNVRDASNRQSLYRVRLDTPIDPDPAKMAAEIDAAVAAMFEKDRAPPPHRNAISATVNLMRRSRKLIAVFCVVCVVFAVLAPVAAANLVQVVLVSLWLVVPVIAVAVIRCAAVRCHEQLASLRSLLPSRAPPTHAVLA
jgi:hypothetical protein